MWREIARTVTAEWRRLEVHVEPTRLILLFCLLFMLPRYHRFVLGPPWLNQFLMFQALLPVAVILIIYREDPRKWGLGFGDWKRGLQFTALFLLLYLPCFVILVTNDEFAAYYGKVSSRNVDWYVFVHARLEAIASLGRTELFYRGFLLFGLQKYFKEHDANLIHLIPYGIAHIGKPELECVGSLLVGYFLGYLALRTRSVWYGLFLHWFFASSFTLFYVIVA